MPVMASVAPACGAPPSAAAAMPPAPPKLSAAKLPGPLGLPPHEARNTGAPAPTPRESSAESGAPDVAASSRGEPP
eukprot:366038-Chlamydomonas_euryale.AAC.2